MWDLRGKAAGLNVELQGSSVGTWLQRYRDGKMPFGLSIWGPDYPDPSDYLAFLPVLVAAWLVWFARGWRMWLATKSCPTSLSTSPAWWPCRPGRG